MASRSIAAKAALAFHCLVLLASVSRVEAQELEPRAFSPGPTGLNIAVVSAVYSTGDLVFDSSVPIEDATARVRTGVLGYQRFFELFAKTAKASISATWNDAHAEGNVGEQFRERNFDGPGDPRVSLSVILKGAPAMTGDEYAGYRPHTLAGVSVGMSLPLGEYDEERILNSGTNRWTFRGQFGLAHYRGPWTFEGTLGISAFTDNDEYLVSSTQSQQPIYSLQAHVGRTFRPGLWISSSATYYRGGATRVDGIRQPGEQSNSRAGVTASYPLGKGQGLVAAFSRGFVVRTGGDFDTFSLAWQLRWADR